MVIEFTYNVILAIRKTIYIYIYTGFYRENVMIIIHKTVFAAARVLTGLLVDLLQPQSSIAEKDDGAYY